MTNIIDLLKLYDKKYNDAEPIVSDTEYDKLRETAKELHPDDPYFDTVGADTTGEKVKLPYIMGSLNKVKVDTVIKWLKDSEAKLFVISEKIDGASFMVEYQDGFPIAGYTRGDGEKGKDISDKVKLFCPSMDMGGYWCFRGEAVLPNPADFGYKNRRNGAAGLLNKDDATNCQYLRPWFFEIIETDNKFYRDRMGDEAGRWDILEEIFPVNTPGHWYLDIQETRIKGRTEDRLVAILKNSRERNKLYEVDGLVLTINESERENVAYPDNKIAFKVNLDAVKTTVEDIEWSVTRTGRIVPVVVVDPIDIQGVTVERVTGHNYELLAKMGAGIGAEIGIVRSGDVIPYIEEVYTASGNLGHFHSCPSCFGETDIKGVDIACPNNRCPEKVYHELEYWFRTLGAENLTAVTLKKLGDHIALYADVPPTIFQIYNMERYEMESIEGFGRKRAKQVYEEIHSTLNTTHEKLLAAFGIPNVAKEIAAELIRHFGSVGAVLSAPYEELTEVEGVGITVGSYIKGNQYRCGEIFINLQHNYGLQLEERVVGALDGKVFCITGKLPMKRDAIVRMIEDKGGVWKNSVTKKTDYLVTDNPNSGSGKNKKANQYGTKIITFDELQEMIS